MKEIGLLNQEMKKVKERVTQIDSLVENMEIDQNHFNTEIVTFEKEYERMEELRPVKNPGERIKELMEKWDQEEVPNQDDLIKYAVTTLK